MSLAAGAGVGVVAGLGGPAAMLFFSRTYAR
jgi:hypothetical protein